ncbi:hypothetical protein BKA69DRAFT_170522 [Paraphysoderma sedebokerense]|nr:hypothetical protein BKA69DRAFT_170522 [Paraphysoderma sedebokerense]
MQTFNHFNFIRPYTEHPPLLYVSQALWVILGGWVLFLQYLMGALSLVLTIILIPWAWQAAKFAVFALLPVGREPYTPARQPAAGRGLSWNRLQNIMKDPKHPLTIAANVYWLLLWGWNIFLAHWIFAIIQALTIVGIGNAVNHARLAVFALWPLGKEIRDKTPKAFPTKPTGSSSIV